MSLFIFLYCTLVVTGADSARILGVFPIPSISHQQVHGALTKELAKRGHELVVVTPSPNIIKDKSQDNIKVIDMNHTFDIQDKSYGPEMFKRGVFVDVEATADLQNYIKMADIVLNEMEHPEVKKLIEDKNQHFDLILIEAFTNIHLIFTEIFKAPAILITSFHGFPETFELMGAVGRHPLFYPHPYRQKYGGNTMAEKLWYVKMEYNFMCTLKQLEDYESQILKTKFGPNTPTVGELNNNIDLLFVSLNPVFRDNRPVTPNIVYVGPLHLQPVKSLPEILQSYLDQSVKGVIYVSLGTNVRTSFMDNDLIDAFLDTFEALPYDFLWKFDDKLKRMPKNLRIQKWFPQRDLLAHPKIKLFITQGGLQSTEEAIDAGVPMVVIPTTVDQFYNAYKYEQLGIGVGLDVLTLDARSLVGAVEEVLRNDSYKTNIKKLKEIINDQVQTPMERAIWWTEYVIRHKGAKHLRSPAANISWTEYLMIDVLISLISFLLLMTLILVLVLKQALRLYKRLQHKSKSKPS